MIEFDLQDNGNTDESDADGANDQDAKIVGDDDDHEHFAVDDDIDFLLILTQELHTSDLLERTIVLASSQTNRSLSC